MPIHKSTLEFIQHIINEVTSPSFQPKNVEVLTQHPDDDVIMTTFPSIQYLTTHQFELDFDQKISLTDLKDSIDCDVHLPIDVLDNYNYILLLQLIIHVKHYCLLYWIFTHNDDLQVDLDLTFESTGKTPFLIFLDGLECFSIIKKELITDTVLPSTTSLHQTELSPQSHTPPTADWFTPVISTSERILFYHFLALETTVTPLHLVVILQSIPQWDQFLLALDLLPYLHIHNHQLFDIVALFTNTLLYRHDDIYIQYIYSSLEQWILLYLQLQWGYTNINPITLSIIQYISILNIYLTTLSPTSHTIHRIYQLSQQSFHLNITNVNFEPKLYCLPISESTPLPPLSSSPQCTSTKSTNQHQDDNAGNNHSSNNNTTTNNNDNEYVHLHTYILTPHYFKSITSSLPIIPPSNYTNLDPVTQFSPQQHLQPDIPVAYPNNDDNNTLPSCSTTAYIHHLQPHGNNNNDSKSQKNSFDYRKKTFLRQMATIASIQQQSRKKSPTELYPKDHLLSLTIGVCEDSKKKRKLVQRHIKRTSTDYNRYTNDLSQAALLPQVPNISNLIHGAGVNMHPINVNIKLESIAIENLTRAQLLAQVCLELPHFNPLFVLFRYSYPITTITYILYMLLQISFALDFVLPVFPSTLLDLIDSFCEVQYFHRISRIILNKTDNNTTTKIDHFYLEPIQQKRLTNVLSTQIFTHFYSFYHAKLSPKIEFPFNMTRVSQLRSLLSLELKAQANLIKHIPFPSVMMFTVPIQLDPINSTMYSGQNQSQIKLTPKQQLVRLIQDKSTHQENPQGDLHHQYYLNEIHSLPASRTITSEILFPPHHYKPKRAPASFLSSITSFLTRNDEPHLDQQVKQIRTEQHQSDGIDLIEPRYTAFPTWMPLGQHSATSFLTYDMLNVDKMFIYQNNFSTHYYLHFQFTTLKHPNETIQSTIEASSQSSNHHHYHAPYKFSLKRVNSKPIKPIKRDEPIETLLNTEENKSFSQQNQSKMLNQRQYDFYMGLSRLAQFLKITSPNQIDVSKLDLTSLSKHFQLISVNGGTSPLGISESPQDKGNNDTTTITTNNNDDTSTTKSRGMLTKPIFNLFTSDTISPISSTLHDLQTSQRAHTKYSKFQSITSSSYPILPTLFDLGLFIVLCLGTYKAWTAINHTHDSYLPQPRPQAPSSSLSHEIDFVTNFATIANKDDTQLLETMTELFNLTRNYVTTQTRSTMATVLFLLRKYSIKVSAIVSKSLLVRIALAITSHLELAEKFSLFSRFEITRLGGCNYSNSFSSNVHCGIATGIFKPFVSAYSSVVSFLYYLQQQIMYKGFSLFETTTDNIISAYMKHYTMYTAYRPATMNYVYGQLSGLLLLQHDASDFMSKFSSGYFNDCFQSPQVSDSIEHTKPFQYDFNHNNDERTTSKSNVGRDNEFYLQLHNPAIIHHLIHFINQTYYHTHIKNNDVQHCFDIYYTQRDLQLQDYTSAYTQQQTYDFSQHTFTQPPKHHTFSAPNYTKFSPVEPLSIPLNQTLDSLQSQQYESIYYSHHVNTQKVLCFQFPLYQLILNLLYINPDNRHIDLATMQNQFGCDVPMYFIHRPLTTTEMAVEFKEDCMHARTRDIGLSLRGLYSTEQLSTFGYFNSRFVNPDLFSIRKWQLKDLFKVQHTIQDIHEVLYNPSNQITRKDQECDPPQDDSALDNNTSFSSALSTLFDVVLQSELDCNTYCSFKNSLPIPQSGYTFNLPQNYLTLASMLLPTFIYHPDFGGHHHSFLYPFVQLFHQRFGFDLGIAYARSISQPTSDEDLHRILNAITNTNRLPVYPLHPEKLSTHVTSHRFPLLDAFSNLRTSFLHGLTSTQGQKFFINLNTYQQKLFTLLNTLFISTESARVTFHDIMNTLPYSFQSLQKHSKTAPTSPYFHTNVMLNYDPYYNSNTSQDSYDEFTHLLLPPNLISLALAAPLPVNTFDHVINKATTLTSPSPGNEDDKGDDDLSIVQFEHFCTSWQDFLDTCSSSIKQHVSVFQCVPQLLAYTVPSTFSIIDPRFPNEHYSTDPHEHSFLSSTHRNSPLSLTPSIPTTITYYPIEKWLLDPNSPIWVSSSNCSASVEGTVLQTTIFPPLLYQWAVPQQHSRFSPQSNYIDQLPTSQSLYSRLLHHHSLNSGFLIQDIHPPLDTALEDVSSSTLSRIETSKSTIISTLVDKDANNQLDPQEITSLPLWDVEFHSRASKLDILSQFQRKAAFLYEQNDFTTPITYSNNNAPISYSTSFEPGVQLVYHYKTTNTFDKWSFLSAGKGKQGLHNEYDPNYFDLWEMYNQDTIANLLPTDSPPNKIVSPKQLCSILDQIYSPHGNERYSPQNDPISLTQPQPFSSTHYRPFTPSITSLPADTLHAHKSNWLNPTYTHPSIATMANLVTLLSYLAVAMIPYDLNIPYSGLDDALNEKRKMWYPARRLVPQPTNQRITPTPFYLCSQYSRILQVSPYVKSLINFSIPSHWSMIFLAWLGDAMRYVPIIDNTTQLSILSTLHTAWFKYGDLTTRSHRKVDQFARHHNPSPQFSNPETPLNILTGKGTPINVHAYAQCIGKYPPALSFNEHYLLQNSRKFRQSNTSITHRIPQFSCTCTVNNTIPTQSGFFSPTQSAQVLQNLSELATHSGVRPHQTVTQSCIVDLYTPSCPIHGVLCEFPVKIPDIQPQVHFYKPQNQIDLYLTDTMSRLSSLSNAGSDIAIQLLNMNIFNISFHLSSLSPLRQTPRELHSTTFWITFINSMVNRPINTDGEFISVSSFSSLLIFTQALFKLFYHVPATNFGPQSPHVAKNDTESTQPHVLSSYSALTHSILNKFGEELISTDYPRYHLQQQAVSSLIGYVSLLRVTPLPSKGHHKQFYHLHGDLWTQLECDLLNVLREMIYIIAEKVISAHFYNIYNTSPLPSLFTHHHQYFNHDAFIQSATNDKSEATSSDSNKTDNVRFPLRPHEHALHPLHSVINPQTPYTHAFPFEAADISYSTPTYRMPSLLNLPHYYFADHPLQCVVNLDNLLYSHTIHTHKINTNKANPHGQQNHHHHQQQQHPTFSSQPMFNHHILPLVDHIRAIQFAKYGSAPNVLPHLDQTHQQPLFLLLDQLISNNRIMFRIHSFQFHLYHALLYTMLLTYHGNIPDDIVDYLQKQDITGSQNHSQTTHTIKNPQQLLFEVYINRIGIELGLVQDVESILNQMYVQHNYECSDGEHPWNPTPERLTTMLMSDGSLGLTQYYYNLLQMVISPRNPLVINYFTYKLCPQARLPLVSFHTEQNLITKYANNNFFQTLMFSAQIPMTPELCTTERDGFLQYRTSIQFNPTHPRHVINPHPPTHEFQNYIHSSPPSSLISTSYIIPTSNYTSTLRSLLYSPDGKDLRFPRWTKEHIHLLNSFENFYVSNVTFINGLVLPDQPLHPSITIHNENDFFKEMTWKSTYLTRLHKWLPAQLHYNIVSILLQSPLVSPGYTTVRFGKDPLTLLSPQHHLNPNKLYQGNTSTNQVQTPYSLQQFFNTNSTLHLSSETANSPHFTPHQDIDPQHQCHPRFQNNSDCLKLMVSPLDKNKTKATKLVNAIEAAIKHQEGPDAYESFISIRQTSTFTTPVIFQANTSQNTPLYSHYQERLLNPFERQLLSSRNRISTGMREVFIGSGDDVLVDFAPAPSHDNLNQLQPIVRYMDHLYDYIIHICRNDNPNEISSHEIDMVQYLLDIDFQFMFNNYPLSHWMLKQKEFYSQYSVIIPSKLAAKQNNDVSHVLDHTSAVLIGGVEKKDINSDLNTRFNPFVLNMYLEYSGYNIHRAIAYFLYMYPYQYDSNAVYLVSIMLQRIKQIQPFVIFALLSSTIRQKHSHYYFQMLNLLLSALPPSASTKIPTFQSNQTDSVKNRGIDNYTKDILEKNNIKICYDQSNHSTLDMAFHAHLAKHFIHFPHLHIAFARYACSHISIPSIISIMCPPSLYRQNIYTQLQLNHSFQQQSFNQQLIQYPYGTQPPQFTTMTKTTQNIILVVCDRVGIKLMGSEMNAFTNAHRQTQQNTQNMRRRGTYNQEDHNISCNITVDGVLKPSPSQLIYQHAILFLVQLQHFSRTVDVTKHHLYKLMNRFSHHHDDNNKSNTNVGSSSSIFPTTVSKLVTNLLYRHYLLFLTHLNRQPQPTPFWLSFQHVAPLLKSSYQLIRNPHHKHYLLPRLLPYNYGTPTAASFTFFPTIKSHLFSDITEKNTYHEPLFATIPEAILSLLLVQSSLSTAVAESRGFFNLNIIPRANDNVDLTPLQLYALVKKSTSSGCIIDWSHLEQIRTHTTLEDMFSSMCNIHMKKDNNNKDGTGDDIENNTSPSQALSQPSYTVYDPAIMFLTHLDTLSNRKQFPLTTVKTSPIIKLLYPCDDCGHIWFDPENTSAKHYHKEFWFVRQSLYFLSHQSTDLTGKLFGQTPNETINVAGFAQSTASFFTNTPTHHQHSYLPDTIGAVDDNLDDIDADEPGDNEDDDHHSDDENDDDQTVIDNYLKPLKVHKTVIKKQDLHTEKLLDMNYMSLNLTENDGILFFLLKFVSKNGIQNNLDDLIYLLYLQSVPDQTHPYNTVLPAISNDIPSVNTVLQSPTYMSTTIDTDYCHDGYIVGLKHIHHHTHRNILQEMIYLNYDSNTINIVFNVMIQRYGYYMIPPISLQFEDGDDDSFVELSQPTTLLNHRDIFGFDLLDYIQMFYHTPNELDGIIQDLQHGYGV